MLFGFAINYNDGHTDYALVSAPDLATAESDLAAFGPPCEHIESVAHYDAESIVHEHYDCSVFLTTEYHVPEDA